jgi:hypothetical protein
MSLDWARNLNQLIWGPLLVGQDSNSAPQVPAYGRPLCFRAVLCDLRPRFIPKCRVGRGYRAVARNGRVLLASNEPMELLIERQADIRLQPWRKVILAGERPEVYGLLMCARSFDPDHRPGLESEAVYHSYLVREAQSSADLAVDVGGGMMLVFLAPD